jgi:transposase
MEKELEVNNLKLSTAEQETLRKKIIRIAKKNLKPNGKPNAKVVSEICECSVSHVRGTWRKYQDGGVSAIKTTKMGRPSNSGALTSEQQQTIQKCLIDKDPNQLKLPGYLWNRSNIQGLIKHLFKIELTLQAISIYLKRWGFTPQRPIKKSYKQNPEVIKTWLNEEYPEIKKRAKEENAEIHWGDETGCQNESNYIKGYAPRGKTPVLPVGNEKIKVNMISSITNQGKLRFMFYREKMNGKMLIKFMRRLIKDSSRKIFLILDNLKPHHSIVVQEWLREHKEQIEVFYLPSYAPQYNPDEYLNGNLKREMAERGYSKNEDEIESKARGIMKTFQRNPDHVASFFHAPNANYAQ